MKILYVYILECADGTYYTGITNNLDKRLLQHNIGTDREAYTYTKRPVRLVFREMFKDVNQAIAFEKRIKGWRRDKKLALIEGRWEDLPELARTSKTLSNPDPSTGSG